MKNLVLIAFALVAFTVSAQPGNPQRKGKKDLAEKTKDWTPEQKAELATKKMTLDLNLTEAQQQKIYPIHLEMMKDRVKRKANKEKKSDLSSTELFDLQNARLEKKIKTKKQFKDILTTEQFESWEKKHATNKRMKRRMKSRNK